MNPILISVSVFFGSISVSSGSTGIEPATVNPNYPNHCYNKETNGYYKDGESWPINGCGVASCIKIIRSPGNAQMMISYESCGSVGYEPPCYTTEAKDTSYPDCCPEVVCPESEEAQFNENDINNEINSWISKRRNETEKNKQAYKLYTPSGNSISEQREWRNVDKQDNFQSLDSDVQSEDEYYYTPRQASPRRFFLY